MLKRVIWFLMLGLSPGVLFSQDAYWCDEFAVPDTEAAKAMENDSGALEIASTVSLYQTFKMRNQLAWERRLPWGAFEQSVEYQLLQLSPKSRIQSLDFSGDIINKNFMIDGLDAGFEWTPIVSYTRDSIGTMQSSIDIGPVVRHELFTIPYSLRGGLYGYTWNSAISSLSTAPLRGYHGYPGLYAGFTVGDPHRPVAEIPLWLSVNALGRSIKRNTIGLLSASALFADDIPVFGGGDSLFLHVGDSVTNGKELYIGESSEGKPFFSNTSWRINHSFSGSGGVKTKERMGVRTLLYYQYYLHSIAYPSKSKALDDIRTIGQKLGIGVNTREESPLSYHGGIEFVWEFEDWLYRHRFGSDESVYSRITRNANGIPVDTVTNRDSLIINQSDHYSDFARTNHEVRLQLPWGISSEYSFGAFKDSKKFPFFYRDPTGLSPLDTIWNRNENDRIQIDHRLSFRYDHRDSLFFIETYGSYRILYQYYYRAQRSADSKRTNEYRLGLDVGCSIGPVELHEHLYGNAELAEFKRFDVVKYKPPPYTRDVTSTLSGKWKIRENRFHLIGQWIEMYHDDGVWYGSDFWPESDTLHHEYYAVERKRTQYWLDFSLESYFSLCKLTVGSTFRDVFQRQFSWLLNEYVVSDLDRGYGIEPYLLLGWQSDRLLLNLRLKRIFNTGDSERWNRMKNWDLSLSLQMEL